MKVTFNQFETVLNTLPISLYAKRKIDASLSDKEDTSYYVPLEDRIVISYPSMENIYRIVQDVKDLESSIRAVLYHEISHAILTPKGLYGGEKQLYRDVINIFEDERIETILKDYYYGVNFKRNIIMLNNWHGEEPTNAVEEFYSTVRFRTGKKIYLEEVKQIINKYSDITQTEDGYYLRQRINEYRQDMINLFLKIAKDWMEENQKEELIKDTPNYDDLYDPQKVDAVKKTLDRLNADKPMCRHIIITSSDQGNEEDGKPVEGAIPLSKEDLDRIMDELNSTDIEEDPQEMLESILNTFIDKDLIESFKMIFENFLSRTKNNAGAIQRYSGVLNPRSIGRQDWRIFDYKANNGPINGYDKLHLNLFIDTSGSYRSNEEKTNTILKALEILEQTYTFFEFDLITCQCGEQMHDRKHRFIHANGGNRLDEKIWELYKNVQFSNALNYNVILFDGDAFTDCWSNKDTYTKNFGAFNNSRCSIISDKDNEKYIAKFAPLAHSIIVDGRRSHKSYSNLLYENILNALTRALL